MSKLFSSNAFALLGISTSSSKKEILKQSRKILRTLENEEEHESTIDLGKINQIERTVSSINDAEQRLSSPKKRIREYFFWFDTENDEDAKNLTLLKTGEFEKALDNWKERSTKSYAAKRNLAIASSILLNHTGYEKYINLSINCWRLIFESDRFWSHFEKIYELNDDIGTSKTVLNDFKLDAVNQLSDFYSDVSRTKKDNSIYAAFNKSFVIKGENIQSEVLTPIFSQLNDTSNKLKSLNASADNKLSAKEKLTINKLIKKIQDLFNEIKELGLYDDEHSKIMRDKTAEAISIVAIDLFNNLDEDIKAFALLKIAKSFAAGPKAVSQINKDYKYIDNVISKNRVYEPINNLIEKKEYKEALELIDETIDNSTDSSIVSYLKKRAQYCVIVLANGDFEEAEILIKESNFVESEYWFQSIYDFIYTYLQYFDIDQNYIDDVVKILDDKLAIIDSNVIEAAGMYRQNIITNSNYAKEQVLELPIIVMLLDSLIYLRMSQQLPTIIKKNKNKRLKDWVLNIIVWGAIIGGSSLFFGSIGSDSDTTYNTCVSQYETLKNQLDSIESRMSGYETSGDISSFNSLVPEQNNLVKIVNNKLIECRNLR